MPRQPNPQKQFLTDYKRIHNMLSELEDQLGTDHPFFSDAQLLMRHIKEAGGPSGQLALHLLSVAVSELLSRRGCATKICMIAALALVESGLHEASMEVFNRAYAAHRKDQMPEMPEEVTQLIREIMTNPDKFANMPMGVNEINVGGKKAKVVKFPLGQAPAAQPQKAPKKKKAKTKTKADPFQGDPSRN